jgi:AraC-like DNA-binding protein
MSSFFKYLPTLDFEQNKWLQIQVGGFEIVKPFEIYPNTKHPSNYYFNWEKGRLLHDFQLVYITNGNGILETQDETFEIMEGSIILIKPYVWHRYKPNTLSGWTEYYIGFTGKTIEDILNIPLFAEPIPIFQIHLHDKIRNAYLEILQQIQNENQGYQTIVSGLIIYILGHIIDNQKNQSMADKYLSAAIEKSKDIIRKKMEEKLDLKALATELNLSYSLFRKEFKRFVGVSPAQYHLALKIQEARYLLINGNQNIKQLAENLGFSSTYHFSKIFKEKTGQSPSAFSRHL